MSHAQKLKLKKMHLILCKYVLILTNHDLDSSNLHILFFGFLDSVDQKTKVTPTFYRPELLVSLDTTKFPWC
jgi:hypothetical protein